MKRILALILLAALTLSLVACGSNGGNNGGNNGDSSSKNNFAVPAEGYDGSEVTLKFAHTMGSNLRDVLDYHIGEFNKLYPNIHIEHSSYGAWSAIAGQINTEIMGDNQPNIAYCYPDHVAQYNMAWATVTLDELIASEVTVTRDDGSTEIVGLTDEQKNDFFENFYNEGSVYGDGRMYTMPLSKSIEVLYYNKTFFEENGLSVPTTWEEMEATCKKILEIDPNCVPLGYDSEDNMFITMCEQYGYDYTSASGDEHFLFNNDNCKSFVKQFRDWYQSGYITTEALYGNYTSSLFVEQDKSILHSYMCIGSSGGASYQKSNQDTPDGSFAFEVGIAPIPQANLEAPKVISQGPSLCILQGGKTTDQQIVASWLFVKYLTTNMAFQTEFSTTSGYMPVIKSALEDETYLSWLNNANGTEYLIALSVKNSLEQTDYSFTSVAFNGSSVARKKVGELLASCMADETTDVDNLINKAFDEAYNECKYHAG